MSDKILVQVDIIPHPIGDRAGNVLCVGPSMYQRLYDASIGEAKDDVVRHVKFKRPALFFYINPDDLFFVCGKIVNPGPNFTECLTSVELLTQPSENTDGKLANNDGPRKQ